MDNTSPEGGWTVVLQWLHNNPPPIRTANNLGGGLFANNMSTRICDVIIIHLDTDILDHEEFAEYMRRRYEYNVVSLANPVERGKEMRRIINLAAQISDFTEADQKRHIAAPAVESTECWCVAAFHNVKSDPEELKGDALVLTFMTVLHKSESRPLQKFEKIDKSQDRRQKFIERHRGGFLRLERQSRHYSELVQALLNLP